MYISLFCRQLSSFGINVTQIASIASRCRPNAASEGKRKRFCLAYCYEMTFKVIFIFEGMNTDNTESQRLNKIISEIQALQEVVTRFRQMRLDATEFACLKCIVTFKAGELKSHHQCVLVRWYPGSPLRNWNEAKIRNKTVAPSQCSANTQWFGFEKFPQRQRHCCATGRGTAHSQQLHTHQVTFYSS